jgi:hypothetical protein
MFAGTNIREGCYADMTLLLKLREFPHKNVEIRFVSPSDRKIVPADAPNRLLRRRVLLL